MEAALRPHVHIARLDDALCKHASFFVLQNGDMTTADKELLAAQEHRHCALRGPAYT